MEVAALFPALLNKKRPEGETPGSELYNITAARYFLLRPVEA
jgi:hypothetical protein